VPGRRNEKEGKGSKGRGKDKRKGRRKRKGKSLRKGNSRANLKIRFGGKRRERGRERVFGWWEIRAERNPSFRPPVSRTGKRRRGGSGQIGKNQRAKKKQKKKVRNSSTLCPKTERTLGSSQTEGTRGIPKGEESGKP